MVIILAETACLKTARNGMNYKVYWFITNIGWGCFPRLMHNHKTGIINKTESRVIYIFGNVY